MISVDDALARIFELLAPLPSETVPLRAALGRTLSGSVTSRMTQPPFDTSAMDGYAIATTQAKSGDRFRVIGESAAGHGYSRHVEAGEAVRIFTGAPLPEGAQRILIQEDVSREGDSIVLRDRLDAGLHIRKAGQDFAAGESFEQRDPLRPVDLALLAAMGHGSLPVARKPIVAIIATGDELVAPGDQPGPDQIIASNHVGLAAMVGSAGGTARLLPVARDTPAALDAVFDLTEGADLIVTIGGASVGDHDLVAKIAARRGMKRSFYKVAMRPGKPLMAGKLDGIPMIGLPGNPVSSMVCGEVFIRPALDVLLGRPARARLTLTAPLAHDLAANGPRAHYMRAVMEDGRLKVAERQDSALLGLLARSDALVLRPAHALAASSGDRVEYIPI